jgi:hypothetical protein
LAAWIGRRTIARDGGAGVASQQGSTMSAPDISGMSSRERAARPSDRVMRLHEEGKIDSISFFAPMALGAYQAITDIDNDARYDMARIAMIVGALSVARAQDDTILRQNPIHLLGLILAADLARSNGDDSVAARIDAKLVHAAPRERRRRLPGIRRARERHRERAETTR